MIERQYFPTHENENIDYGLSLGHIAVLRAYMRPIVTDQVAWSVSRSVGQANPSVGLSVTVVSPAKTAEPIELLFGLRTPVGQRNHVLDCGADAPTRKGTFTGVSGPLENIRFRGIG